MANRTYFIESANKNLEDFLDMITVLYAVVTTELVEMDFIKVSVTTFVNDIDFVETIYNALF